MATAAKDKPVTIFGLGRSAVGAARLLLREGAKPFVSELKDTPELAPWRAALEELGVPYEVGGHTERAISKINLAVLSPGVPRDQPFLAPLRDRGIPLISELELAFNFCTSRILAVTGTNGKTTTTELLYHILQHCGHSVALAGNNATPFSEAVLVAPAPEYIVLEVSSYQLESCFNFRPWIAAVLNLTPDHLARHGTMEHYAFTKALIFRRQREGDIAVVNEDDDWVVEMEVAEDSKCLSFSANGARGADLYVSEGKIRSDVRAIASLEDIPLPGRHNVENALCALTMLRAGGFAWNKVIEGLRSFKGVEHRIELVADLEGVKYFNDSKSTNVDSLRVALESFDAPITLIAGGQGKDGSDYASVLPQLKAHVRQAVLLGQDAPAMEAAWGGHLPLQRVDSMEEAVEKASELTEAGGVVLLSPACASFDLYQNFEERGKHFKRCVQDLLARRPASGGVTT